MFKPLPADGNHTLPPSVRATVHISPRSTKERILKIDFVGRINGEVIAQWAKTDAARVLKEVSGYSFYVIADLRLASVLDEKPTDKIKATDMMAEGQKMFLKAGMKKSFVVATSPTVFSQFRRIAEESGIRHDERGVFMLAPNQKAHGASLDNLLTKHTMAWFYDNVEVPPPCELK